MCGRWLSTDFESEVLIWRRTEIVRRAMSVSGWSHTTAMSVSGSSHTTAMSVSGSLPGAVGNH